MTRFPDMVSSVYRFVLFLGAALCVGFAVFLTVSSGLPQRSEFLEGFSVEDGLAIPEKNGIAPDFELISLHGQTLKLSSLRGSPVLLNFWATWCVPCREEMPELEQMYQEYADLGLKILGVNLAESPQRVAAWVDEHQITFDILLDGDETVARQYWLMGPPTTFLISPEGVITHVFGGPISPDDLRRAIETQY